MDVKFSSPHIVMSKYSYYRYPKKRPCMMWKSLGASGLQYQKVLSHDDITHCSHGMPYGPNCGGLYP